MTLDQRLTHAARQVADGVTPPQVDLDAVRSRARTNRRRTVSLAVTAVVVAAVAVGTAVGAGRDSSAPAPPAQPLPSESVADLPESIGDLPAGTPPLTAYWHDGVLHVRDVEIETPFPVGSIEAAGDTVMVGGRPDKNGEVARWALVRGDRLEPLHGPTNYYPSLSVDGRIAFWQIQPTQTPRVSSPGTPRRTASWPPAPCRGPTTLTNGSSCSVSTRTGSPTGSTSRTTPLR